jgi:fermentation-respiration switch protein FrsA (DUF1100 family)
MPGKHWRLEMRRFFSLAAIFTFLIWQSFVPNLIHAAQTDKEKGVEGVWQGALEIGSTKLRIVFNLSKSADGSLTGTLDSPDQGATGLKLDTVKVENGKLFVELKMVGGSFTGAVSPDGSEIAGQWSQGGNSLPLVLKKTEKAAEVSRRPQEPRKPYPYDEEEVTFENREAGITLAGALTLPRDKRPCPAVVLISGSGPQDRDESLLGHKPFLVLADHLTRKGIAVLRYDDRGVGKSKGDFSKATTEDFASDALAAVQFLRSRKEIDSRRIGLAGHSEGGVIAPMAAAKSTDVAYIVLLAGTGLTGEEILYMQGALIAKANGATDDAVARQRSSQEQIFTVLKREKDNAVAEKAIRELSAKMMAQLTDEQKKTAPAMGANEEARLRSVLSPWFRYFLTYDPRPALKQLKCPVLAVNGELDLQVPANENLEQIEKALKEGGNKRYKIVKLPGLNHLFQSCKTGSPLEYAQIDETFSPSALEVVSNWILEQTRQ